MVQLVSKPNIMVEVTTMVLIVTVQVMIMMNMIILIFIMMRHSNCCTGRRIHTVKQDSLCNSYIYTSYLLLYEKSARCCRFAVQT